MSFYLLELVLERDLIRKDYLVYNNKEKIKEKLYSYLISGQGCYEAVWYGAVINLCIFRNYQLIKKMDMHAYMIFELDEYSQIYFDADNQPIAIKNNDTVITKDDAEFDEHFCVKVVNGDENIDVKIDMSSVPILEGRLLEKQEIFMIEGLPGIKFHYGHNDLEFGNDISDSESEMDASINEDSDEEASFDEMDMVRVI